MSAISSGIYNSKGFSTVP